MTMKRKDRDVVGVAAKDIPRAASSNPAGETGSSARNGVSPNVRGHGNAQMSGTANRRGNNPKNRGRTKQFG